MMYFYLRDDGLLEITGSSDEDVRKMAALSRRLKGDSPRRAAEFYEDYKAYPGVGQHGNGTRGARPKLATYDSTARRAVVDDFGNVVENPIIK